MQRYHNLVDDLRTANASLIFYGEATNPNRIRHSVFCKPEANGYIYTGGFEKTAWHRDTFANYGTENLVCILKYSPHSIKKRMLSNIYSKSYLQKSPDLHKLSSILIVDRFLPL